jgi:hypothetical protein
MGCLIAELRGGLCNRLPNKTLQILCPQAGATAAGGIRQVEIFDLASVVADPVVNSLPGNSKQVGHLTRWETVVKRQQGGRPAIYAQITRVCQLEVELQFLITR